MEGGHSIQTLTCPLPLVNTSLLLAASLGGLLHNRLLERRERHTEDAHCSGSTMKTQMTRKIPRLGPRAHCSMRPHACVISPGFVSPLVLPLGLSIHMLSCSQALLLFLSLSLSYKGSCLPTVLPDIPPRSPQRENKLHLEGAVGYLISSPRASVGTKSRDQYSPPGSWPCPGPPTSPSCLTPTDWFPKESRLVETRAFCSIISHYLLSPPFPSFHKI